MRIRAGIFLLDSLRFRVKVFYNDGENTLLNKFKSVFFFRAMP